MHAKSDTTINLTLKAPLDDAALGNLLGSLRKSFGASEAQDPAASATEMAKTQTQSKDLSFSALLDTSQIFEDDDDEGYDVGGPSPYSSADALCFVTVAGESEYARCKKRPVRYCVRSVPCRRGSLEAFPHACQYDRVWTVTRIQRATKATS